LRTGLADVAIPDIPIKIAEQMRALWQAAVAVQLNDVVRLKTDAQQAIAAADSARTDAESSKHFIFIKGLRDSVLPD
jgi:hypothetical protein